MESFDILVQRYERMIWKIIQSLHIYKSKEEFYQTGLIALWEASKRYDSEKGNFTGFAYAYIKGKIMTELTKAHKQETRSVYPEEEFWDSLGDNSHEPAMETEFILSFCGHLTENQKKWVLYTAIDFLSVKEIAEIEQVSVSAVKSWRKGAREKLKGRLIFIE